MIFAIMLLEGQAELGNIDLNTMPLVVLMGVIILVVVVTMGLIARTLTKSNKEAVAMYKDTLESILENSGNTNSRNVETLERAVNGVERINQQQVEHGRLQVEQNKQIIGGIAENKNDHILIMDGIQGQGNVMADFMSDVKAEIAAIKADVSSSKDYNSEIRDIVMDLVETRGRNGDAIQRLDKKMQERNDWEKVIDQKLDSILTLLSASDSAPGLAPPDDHNVQ